MNRPGSHKIVQVHILARECPIPRRDMRILTPTGFPWAKASRTRWVSAVDSWAACSSDRNRPTAASNRTGITPLGGAPLALATWIFCSKPTRRAGGQIRGRTALPCRTRFLRHLWRRLHSLAPYGFCRASLGHSSRSEAFEPPTESFADAP